MLKATVSGSFHRHMVAITAAVHELAALSVRVLSPADPRIVAQQGEFLFVASDRVRSVKLVQSRHLDCIRASDFLWLVCPDGYVGSSACLEIGAAITGRVSIFAVRLPTDLTLREYVTTVPNIAAAVKIVATRPRERRSEGLLIDPHASVQQAHKLLEAIETGLTTESASKETSRRVYSDIANLTATMALPSFVQ